MAAAPNAVGDARRSSAWLRAKVKSRENSWRAINEEAEAIEVLSSRPAGKPIVGFVDMDVFGQFLPFIEANNFRTMRPGCV